LRIFHIRRNLAIGSAALLLIGLIISGASNYALLLLGWFLVGQCCGVLSYLGTMTASRFPRRTFAFSLRLAIVLIAAGLVSGLLQANNLLVSYANLLMALILIAIPMLSLGIMLYRHEDGSMGVREYNKISSWSIARSSGLVIVYCFFVGQTGFIAYIIQQAIGRGMTLDSTVWSLAAMKLAAGFWILCSTYLGSEDRRNTQFLSVSLLLVGAIVALAYSRDTVVFFSAFLMLEVSLNKLSARLQAAVVAARPDFSGPWLTGVMLLGAASGPPLNGLMISRGLEAGFVAVAVLSALAPLLWLRLSGSSARPVERLGKDLAPSSAK
jgi:hypothetical protein